MAWAKSAPSAGVERKRQQVVATNAAERAEAILKVMIEISADLPSVKPSDASFAGVLSAWSAIRSERAYFCQSWTNCSEHARAPYHDVGDPHDGISEFGAPKVRKRNTSTHLADTEVPETGQPSFGHSTLKCNLDCCVSQRRCG